jgi:hypothetical protein
MVCTASSKSQYFCSRFLLLGASSRCQPRIHSSPIPFFQMGGQTFFTVIGAYLGGKVPLNAWMLLSIAVVVAGIALSCVPLFGRDLENSRHVHPNRFRVQNSIVSEHAT